MDTLLARNGQTYIVSGFALESAPFVRVLAYKVAASPEDAIGQRVNREWAYTGPRVASYRSPTGLPRKVTYDPSKEADLILDFALTPPKARGKAVRWESGAFVADYADGRRRLVVYEGEHLQGFIAGAFTSGRSDDVLPPEVRR